jgi:hypothetical protein
MQILGCSSSLYLTALYEAKQDHTNISECLKKLSAVLKALLAE